MREITIGHDNMPQITIYQRAVSPEIGKLQLWFLCSACCLMMVNISVKLCEDILTLIN